MQGDTYGPPTYNTPPGKMDVKDPGWRRWGTVVLIAALTTLGLTSLQYVALVQCPTAPLLGLVALALMTVALARYGLKITARGTLLWVFLLALLPLGALGCGLLLGAHVATRTGSRTTTRRPRTGVLHDGFNVFASVALLFGAFGSMSFVAAVAVSAAMTGCLSPLGSGLEASATFALLGGTTLAIAGCAVVFRWPWLATLGFTAAGVLSISFPNLSFVMCALLYAVAAGSAGAAALLWTIEQRREANRRGGDAAE